MKRIISTLLICIFIMNIVVAEALAQEDGTYTNDSFNYTVKNDNITITGFCGTETDVVIPKYIDGVKVTQIGNAAFQDKASVISISLPDSIESINNYNTFWYCRGLKSINLPSSLSFLAVGAFSGCSALEEVVIPDGITSLSKTFRGCTALKKVVIPESVTSIDDGTFYKSVTGSKELLSGVVIYCPYGSYAESFAISKGLKYVTTSSSKSFSYVANTDGEKTATVTGFKADYVPEGDIVLPEKIDGYTITRIGQEAFLNCSKITSFEMPDTVTSISFSAFWACSNLESVKLSKNITGAMSGTFAYCSKLKSVIIPAGVTSIRKTFIACKNLKEVILYNGLKTIDIDTFQSCIALEKLLLPATITSIADNAFLYCNTSGITAYVRNKDCYSAKYATSKGMIISLVSDSNIAVENKNVTFDGNYPTINATIYSQDFVGLTTVVCALYDNDENTTSLYALSTQNVKCDFGERQNVSFSFNVEYKDSLTYKMFVLNSLGDLKPLSCAFPRDFTELSEKNNTFVSLNENFTANSSWDKNMEHTGSAGTGSIKGLTNVILNDTSEWLPSEAYRSIPKTNSEKLAVEFDFSLSKYMDDTSFRLLDGESNVFGIVTGDTHIYLEQPSNNRIQLMEYAPGIDDLNASYYVKAELDFKQKKITRVQINGETLAENCEFVNDATGVDGFDFLIGQQTTGVMVNRKLDVYSNYIVRENYINLPGTLPDDWQYNFGGASASYYEINSRMPDRYSLNLDTSNGSAKVWKIIEPTGGILVYETMLLLPEKRDGVALTLKNGTSEIISIKTDGQSFVCMGDDYSESVYTYSENVWYGIKIELDLVNSKAKVYVNNKLKLDNVAINPYIYKLDTIEITANENVNPVIIDNIKLYNKKTIAEDYVTKPTKLTSTKKFVTGMQMCPLWTEGQYNKSWDYIKSAPGRMPILGAYDEGNPEVSDWEIKWMIEHGIDYQSICIYPNIHKAGDTSYQPIKPDVVREGNALYEGFMNAEYSDMMKFSIIFENNTMTSGKDHYDEFFNVYLPYWIEYYFKDDRYLKIDSRPVVSIYVMDKFLNMFGNIDGTEDDLVMAGLNRFRQTCIDAGVGNPYIISHGIGYTESIFQKYSKYGIDCIGLYGWGSGVDNPPLNQKRGLRYMPQWSNTYNIDFVTSVCPNHDSIAWDVKTGFHSTIEEYTDLLTWVRDDLEPQIQPKNLSKKLFLYQTWNEYGEGHIMAPTARDGFDYLDVGKRVFFGEDNHTDAAPTNNQLTRVQKMVTQDRKVNFAQEKMVPEIPSKVKKGWYFNSSEDASCWSAGDYVSDITLKNDKMYVTASGNYPEIVLNNVPDMDLFDVTYIKLRMKTNSNSTGGEAYWTTNKESSYDSKKKTHFSVSSSMLTGVEDFYIPVGQNVRWTGKLTGLKIMLGDVWDKSTKFEIESIELLSDEDITNGAKICIDGQISPLGGTPQYKNGVLMVPMRSIAETAGAKVGWYAHDNSYTITYGSYITTLFKIGEKNGYKNNFEVTFDEAPYAVSDSINDTVYVPLTLIEEALNMKISWDAQTSTINIYQNEGYFDITDTEEILNAEIFTNTSTLSSINQFTNVIKGYRCFYAKSTGTDPNFCTNKFSGVLTNGVKSVRIRVYSPAQTYLKAYFTTANSSTVNVAKSSSYIKIEPGKNIIDIPVSKFYNWTNQELRKFRLDPIECEGMVEIDYIALIKN